MTEHETRRHLAVGVPTLKPSLKIRSVVLITVSGVTPASSIFVIAPAAIQQAGSGVVIAFLIAGLLALAAAFCYAELSAAHRSAGGEYVMTKRVFGPLPGYLTFVSALALNVFVPAVLASGAAPYLNHALDTRFAPSSVALVLLLLSYGSALLNIKTNALITGCFLSIEVGVLALLAALGLNHPQRPVSVLIHPLVASHGQLAPAFAAAIVPAIGTAIFCYNGFGAAVFLAEELEGGNRHIAKAVLVSLATILLLELIPLTAIVMGAPSLLAIAHGAQPIGDLIQQLAGVSAARLVSGGIFLSVLNAIIAIVLFNSRLLYSSGRHALWNRACNHLFTQLHPRFDSPWMATLVLAIPSIGLSFVSSLEQLTSFTIDLLLLIYLAVAFAALGSRILRRDIEHAYRMPLWPLPPLIVIAGTGYVLATMVTTTAANADLYVIAGLLSAAFAVYWGWARHSETFQRL